MFRRSKAPRWVIAASLMMATHASASDDKVAQSPPEDTAGAKLQLDLRSPDVTKLYSPAEIERMLASGHRQDIEEVEVEGTREQATPNTPTVWPAIAAPFWAILHPTQAWRILAPLPPDQTRGMDRIRPDATSSLREPAVPPNP